LSALPLSTSAAAAVALAAAAAAAAVDGGDDVAETDSMMTNFAARSVPSGDLASELIITRGQERALLIEIGAVMNGDKVYHENIVLAGIRIHVSQGWRVG